METNDITCYLRLEFQVILIIYGFTHIVYVNFADGLLWLVSCIICFYVLVYFYYALHLPKTCMNQQVDMKPLMKYISWAAVSACA